MTKVRNYRWPLAVILNFGGHIVFRVEMETSISEIDSYIICRRPSVEQTIGAVGEPPDQPVPRAIKGGSY